MEGWAELWTIHLLPQQGWRGCELVCTGLARPESSGHVAPSSPRPGPWQVAGRLCRFPAMWEAEGPEHKKGRMAA